jgi:hypothetical protein
MTAQTGDLTRLGNIPDDYVHVEKIITPGDDLALPDAYLKWYEVRRTEAAIPDEIRDAAREFLRAETAAGRLDISGELGFVVLHLCGDSFFFLIVCTWREQNEMWETLYGRDAGTADRFTPIPQGSHLEVMCVWESPAILHEHQAWSRYLRTARDETAKRAYIEDRFTGSV